MCDPRMRISKSRSPLSFILSVIAASLLLSPACSSPAAKAEQELRQRGLEITEAAFLGQVEAGDLETVRLFLAAGMSPNTEDQGYAALLEAARRGHEKIAVKLMETGADVNARELEAFCKTH
jgi:ankyrin repeat protein